MLLVISNYRQHLFVFWLTHMMTSEGKSLWSLCDGCRELGNPVFDYLVGINIILWEKQRTVQGLFFIQDLSTQESEPLGVELRICGKFLWYLFAGHPNYALAQQGSNVVSMHHTSGSIGIYTTYWHVEWIYHWHFILLMCYKWPIGRVVSNISN